MVAFQGAERDVEHAQRIALLIIFENELAAFNVVELLPDPWQAGQGKVDKEISVEGKRLVQVQRVGVKEKVYLGTGQGTGLVGEVSKMMILFRILHNGLLGFTGTIEGWVACHLHP